MTNNHKQGLHSRPSKNQGALMRAQKRIQDDASRSIGRYTGSSDNSAHKSSSVPGNNKLKITFLGGLENVGEKNMAVIEYESEAIILDCGNSLGIDLPGVNYTINGTDYLATIKHKIMAYVITHGHLDHIGGLKHTVPSFPAPIYGSRYTIGLVQKTFEEPSPETGQIFKPQVITAKLDTHEKLKIGRFSIEFIRVTHSLPDASALCIDTPVGRIIATGDFRLDPEPLDKMPTDTKRLKELGDQGVLLLLSESSYADIEGRVPTESTLQKSFYDIIDNAYGRIFVAAFSSNMNRTQMIINAAVKAGRKVALDGRGMLSYAEIAVKQGILKIPKGTVVPIQQAGSISPGKLLVMCTGGQGEPNAALQRMSEGQHRYVNLNEGDTVVISSSPIPGNEVSYAQLSNRLVRKGVHLFRHPTHEVDGCGPLHVSGHARRGELREMLQLIRPQFFIPVHGGTLRRKFHAELGIQEGLPRKNIALPENGDCMYLSSDSMVHGGPVPHSNLLVDQNGIIVSSAVIQDRLMFSEEGFVSVTLNIHRKSGQLISNPELMSRGVVELGMDDNFTKSLATEIRRAITQRYKRISVDRFQLELRDFVLGFVYSYNGMCPIVTTTVNELGLKADPQVDTSAKTQERDAKLEYDQKRFAEMRARLLVHDK
ncbi:MAG: ribonuclease J [Candidatus Saccharimonadales bacterium]